MNMKPVKKILSACLYVLFALLCLEILMIVLEPYLYHGDMQYDPACGYRTRPYSMGSNRFGFNARDFPLEKRPHTYRILIIGDSFNWIGGHDWNYTVFINNKFRQYFGDDRIEVINAGYLGTHTGEQLAMLKRYGLRYHPDLVFLGFFAGNDFFDADPNRKRIIIDDDFVDIDPRHELIWFGRPIVFSSRLAHFFKREYKSLKELVKNRGRAKPKGAPSEYEIIGIDYELMKFCNLKQQQAGVWEANKDYIFRSIIEMQALLKTKKISFMVGIYPDRFQVSRELFDQIVAKYQMNKEEYDFELMQKLLRTFLEQHGIKYVDLLEKFKQAAKTTALYRRYDTHWNEAGNRLAAEIIFPELLSYIPPDMAKAAAAKAPGAPQN